MRAGQPKFSASANGVTVVVPAEGVGEVIQDAAGFAVRGIYRRGIQTSGAGATYRGGAIGAGWENVAGKIHRSRIHAVSADARGVIDRCWLSAPGARPTCLQESPRKIGLL